MKKNQNTSAIALLVIIGLVAALWLRPWSTPSVAAKPLYSGTVVARVAGEPIYLEQAAFRIQGVQSTHEQASQLGEADKSPWPKIVLQSLADDVIFRHEMAMAGVSVAPVTVAAATAKIVDGMGGSGSFQQYLAGAHLTFPQFQSRVYMNLLGGAAYLHVTDGITVTEAEIRAEFDKSPDQFPGKNRELAYQQARPSIAQFLLKQKKDGAFQAWLKAQEAKPNYVITVLEENWWQQTTAQTQASTQDPATAP